MTRSRATAAATDRPQVEFHRSTYLMVAAAVCFGIAGILGAVWYVLSGGGW